ncbi:MAG: 2-oxoacid:ferredoxin oxidoreductase subunit beta [Rhodothermales bacterium]|nr:2-oxoacid:ferredoxin oxidoreductase subunit beta [Rhodothermales bacterium]MBO6778511.1 2-oxoacid:ferredoxin oxidoreductase subunit beta [Rhodothermales bacterium]
MADENKKPRKPTLPPGMEKRKPTLPPGSEKRQPTMPPGAPAGRKATLPPGMKPGGQPAGKRTPNRPPGGNLPPGKKAKLPPGMGGDGASVLTRADFTSDQDVRWCPGCGDYAILATVQRLMPEIDTPKENVVFISGIGCSSRFPYYMKTYGMHSIHGRAPTIATGLKASRPELDVWIVTGDGDGLSIGGNHLIHLMRRNVNVQLLLFNNQIYGLTKGQYSPTSETGKVTKSTPFGSIDHPFNPTALVLGADATFVARTMDRDPKHMKKHLKAAHAHRGTSFLEIYQNCNIFNDGAFFEYTEKATKSDRAIFIEHGKPLTYAGGTKGLRLEGFHLEAVDLGDKWSASDCVVYDETSVELAGIVGRMFRDAVLPQPFGVFYRVERPTYEDQLHAQIKDVTGRRGKGELKALLNAGDTWEVA